MPSGRRARGSAKKNKEAFGPWIVSYADTVTLLLCFFVIFYAEQKKPDESSALIEITESIQSEFSSATSNSSETDSDPSKQSSSLTKEESDKLHLVGSVKKDEVLIRLYAKDFFELGRYEFKDEGKKILSKFAKVFKPYQDKIFIQFEGHTDSLKVKKNALYKSNIGLSSLRASEAALVFLQEDFQESRLRALGLGSSAPLTQDRQPSSEGASVYLPEEGRLNRRVEIRITTSQLDLTDLVNFK